MGKRGARGHVAAPRLEDDDRFIPRSLIGGLQKRIRICQTFKIDQDCAGLIILMEQPNELSHASLGHVTDRKNCREPNPARFCPLEHGCGNCSALRKQCQIARCGCRTREGSVQALVGQHETQTIWTNDPDAAFACSIEHCLTGFATRVKSGRNDHCILDTLIAQCFYCRWHCRSRYRQDCETRPAWYLGDRGEVLGFHPIDGIGINRHQLEQSLPKSEV